MPVLRMDRFSLRWLGAWLCILVVAGLTVCWLFLTETASTPVDSDVEAGAGPVIREDPTAPTSAPFTAADVDRAAPILVAPFRDPNPARTERMTVRGFVFAEGTYPLRPLSGVSVLLKEDSADKACAEGESKADGSFVLEVDWPVDEPVQPDRPFTILRLRAEKEGLVAWHRSSVRLPTHIGSYPDRTYDLFLCSPMVLAGSVVDALTGAPIAGARVAQQGMDPSLSFARSTTDDSGRFEACVADEPAGSLNVDAAGHSGVHVAWAKVTAAEPLVIRLPQPHQIPQVHGRVVGPNGSPHSGVRVGWRFKPPLTDPPAEAERLMRQHLGYLESVHAKRECVTDSNGRFFAALPAFGKWTVMTRVGDMTASRVIDVRDARTYSCELTLEVRALTVRGTVRAKSDQRPIAGAKISIRGSMVMSTADVVSDSKGEFHTAPMVYAPGAEFRAVVHAPQFPAKELTFKPPEGGTEVDIPIELDAPCCMRGIVIDDLGKRVAGATVQASGGGITAEGVTDEAGRFEIGHFQSGIGVRVAASLAGHGSSVEQGVALTSPGEVKDLGTLVLRKR